MRDQSSVIYHSSVVLFSSHSCHFLWRSILSPPAQHSPVVWFLLCWRWWLLARGSRAVRPYTLPFISYCSRTFTSSFIKRSNNRWLMSIIHNHLLFHYSSRSWVCRQEAWPHYLTVRNDECPRRQLRYIRYEITSRCPIFFGRIWRDIVYICSPF